MINVALFGNPNVGKTTVFNLLTGSNQYVGNWPGVTIDKKEGFLGNDIKIVDLPGIYAMDTFSNEEKVSKEFLETGDVDVIVNVVDASNLSRNLYLTTQLMEFNKPIVLLVNMLDIAESKGISIDFNNLSKELGVTVVPIIAKKKNGVDKISLAIKDSVNNRIISIDTINKSVYRILSLKENYKITDEKIKEVDINTINTKFEDILNKINN